jgi:hypothetical protein
VNIKLRSKSTGITAETVSSNGRYQFDNVVPGSYVLEASHPHWSLSFSSSSSGSSSSSISTEFASKWDNTVVPQTISVTGYDINGRVTSETGEPLSGVNFLLYSPSSSSKTLPCVGDSSPNVEGDTTLYPEGRPLCISKSKEGKFRFENVPAGDFRVVPFFKGTHTNFDLFPKEVKVTVQGTVTLSEAFKVIGFSVVGKVVDARGRGVAEASILVNSQQKTKTAADGTYRLESMASGDYTIETQKAHVFFSTLANFLVSPTAPQLPDIVANAYHLCGKVIVDQPLNGISPTKSRTILVKNLGSRSPAKSVQTESGNFCAVVTPGKYSVSVQLTSDELAAGLLLKPSEHNVTIQADPILDLEFRQSLLKITGSVRCLQSPCHPSLYVTLSAIDRNYQGVYSSFPFHLSFCSSYPSLNLYPVTTGIVGDNFTFREVTPGRYRLSINLESWCWQGESSVELQVTDSDLAGISFTQSGYQISVDSTQTTQLTYALASSPASSTPLEVKRGINKICLPQPGIYNFTPSQTCFKFEKEVYRYDTTTGGKIDLVATHYSLRGTVSVTGVTEKQAATKDLISVR